jgi:hypothetical protein
MTRPPLTPCIICEKAVIYLWPEEFGTGDTDNLNGATHLNFYAGYGSEFDCNEYQAIICDECLDKAIQRNRVLFVKEHSLFEQYFEE